MKHYNTHTALSNIHKVYTEHYRVMSENTSPYCNIQNACFYIHLPLLNIHSAYYATDFPAYFNNNILYSDDSPPTNDAFPSFDCRISFTNLSRTAPFDSRTVTVYFRNAQFYSRNLQNYSRTITNHSLTTTKVSLSMPYLSRISLFIYRNINYCSRNADNYSCTDKCCFNTKPNIHNNKHKQYTVINTKHLT